MSKNEGFIRQAFLSRLSIFTPEKAIALAVLFLLIYSQTNISEGLFARSTLSTVLAPMSILIIVAIGQALVMGTGGIDLSVPATVTLTGVIILKATEGKDGGLPEALIICVVACAIIGLINGLLIEGLRLNALVVTLATGQLILGAMRLYGGDILPASDVPPQLSDWAAADLFGVVNYIFVIAVVLSILGTWFLHRVVQGRRLVASSTDERVAFLAGIAARRYRILVYVIASLTYGFGGVLASGDIGTPGMTLGAPYLLLSIVAVVLGGLAIAGGRVSPLATLLGATFIFLLDYNLRVDGLSAGLREVVQGVVLILGLSLMYLSGRLSQVRAVMSRRRTGGGTQVSGSASA